MNSVDNTHYVYKFHWTKKLEDSFKNNPPEVFKKTLASFALQLMIDLNHSPSSGNFFSNWENVFLNLALLKEKELLIHIIKGLISSNGINDVELDKYGKVSKIQEVFEYLTYESKPPINPQQHYHISTFDYIVKQHFDWLEEPFFKKLLLCMDKVQHPFFDSFILKYSYQYPLFFDYCVDNCSTHPTHVFKLICVSIDHFNLTQLETLIGLKDKQDILKTEPVKKLIIDYLMTNYSAYLRKEPCHIEWDRPAYKNKFFALLNTIVPLGKSFDEFKENIANYSKIANQPDFYHYLKVLNEKNNLELNSLENNHDTKIKIL